MKRLLLFLAAAALVFTSACGTLSPYAAKVNGHRISENALDDELGAIKSNKAYFSSIEERLASQGSKVTGAGEGTFDMAFVGRILTRQIVFELMDQELAKRKLELSKTDLDKARKSVEEQFAGAQADMFKKFPKSYRDEIVERTAASDVLGRALLGKIDVTCARHILTGAFSTEPTPEQLAQAKSQADAIKKRLDAGEDFAAVAKAESKDPGSAPQGGDLGCKPAGEYVPEFETAMDKLQPGQISDPVQTQFGFHIIQVQSRKTLAPGDAGADVDTSQLQNDALNEFIDGALRKSRITVNPKYGRFDGKGQSPGVVAPEAPTTSVPDGNQGVPEQSGQPGQSPGK